MTMTDGCVLCEPGPHENCEVYTQVAVEDPMTSQAAFINVCLEHYKVVEAATKTDPL